MVLISFRLETPDSVRQEIYDRYQTLGEDCGGKKAGIVFWSVSRNLERRKNVHLVEFAVYESNAALQAFRAHPKHKELTDILRNVADWQVGDVHYSFFLFFKIFMVSLFLYLRQLWK